MKKSKKVLIVVLVIVLLLIFFAVGTAVAAKTVKASGECGENLTWTLYNNGNLVISGTGEMTAPDNPESVSMPWREYSEKIKYITISDGVTSLAYYAFFDCTSVESITVDENNPYFSSVDGVLFSKDKTLIMLYHKKNRKTEYVIPDSVISIGDIDFNGCSSLKRITIGSGVESIEHHAFQNCTSLESITVSENNSNFSSAGGVLYNKDKTELILCPVKNEKTEYVIPDSVVTIRDIAFNDCSLLKSVTIGSSVEAMYDYTFRYCESLADITVNENNPKYSSADGMLFNKDKTELIMCPVKNGKTEYAIPESVTIIGERAFLDCASLKSVTIPESVISIGKRAFYGCTSLTNITVDENNTKYFSYDHGELFSRYD